MGILIIINIIAFTVASCLRIFTLKKKRKCGAQFMVNVKFGYRIRSLHILLVKFLVKKGRLNILIHKTHECVYKYLVKTPLNLVYIECALAEIPQVYCTQAILYMYIYSKSGYSPPKNAICLCLVETRKLQ